MIKTKNDTNLQLVKAPVKKAKGRPKWLPDLLEVERLATMGLNKEQIATAMGKAASTLYARQHDVPDFLEAYKKGRAQGIARIANRLYEKAMEGDTIAMIFWLKCNAGWRDRGEYQFDGIQEKEKSDIQGVLMLLVESMRKASLANANIIEKPAALLCNPQSELAVIQKNFKDS